MRRCSYKVYPSILFLIVVLSTCSTFSALKPASDWAKFALQLTGESDRVRISALRHLRQTKNLEKKLRAELEGPRWSLALDVITALDMSQLSDDLLKIGRKTHNSFFYLSLNTILNSESQNHILAEYRKILFCNLSPLSTCERTEVEAVVLLETLSRTSEVFSEGEIKTFFKSDSWPEVQSAALEHARRIHQFRPREAEALKAVEMGLVSSYVQIQEQALFLTAQFPQLLKTRAAQFLQACPQEMSIKAQELCKKLKATL